MTTCFGLLFVMWCQPPELPAPVDSFCKIYQPIYLSHSDTRGTKEQVNPKNAAWKAICRGKN
jgi:hypothetical protein